MIHPVVDLFKKIVLKSNRLTCICSSIKALKNKKQIGNATYCAEDQTVSKTRYSITSKVATALSCSETNSLKNKT